jgi:ATP-binding cassette, subfamily B, bacterial CvaB/MchF/RaxB
MTLRKHPSGIRQLLKPYLTYRGLLLAVIASALIVNALVIVTPFLTQLIIDNVISLVAFQESIFIFIGYGLAILVAAIVEFIRSVWMTKILAKVELEAHPAGYGRVFGGDHSFYAKYQASDFISRFQSLRIAHQTASSIVLEGSIDVVFSIAILGTLFAYDIYIASTVLASMVIYIFFRLLLRKSLTTSANKIAKADADQVAFMKNQHDACQSVFFYDAFQLRLTYWYQLTQNRACYEIKRGNALASFKFLQQSCAGIVSVATIAIGTHRVAIGSLSLGSMFALTGLTFALFSRFTLITERLSVLDLVGVHWRRFYELSSPVSKNESSSNNLHKNTAYSLIEGFQIEKLIVDFQGRLVLQAEKLTFLPRELNLITGPSGSGKSTFVRAILGVVDARQLSISRLSVDELEIGDLSISAAMLRRVSGAYFQDDCLFDSHTFAQNISCNEKPNAEEVLAAAKLAFIESDILHSFGGFDAIVNSGQLSAGQVQRILIARALYKRPQIIILDEATSALDESTEEKIIQSIKNTVPIIIAVAHRQQWHKYADRVLIVKNGTVRIEY